MGSHGPAPPGTLGPTGLMLSPPQILTGEEEREQLGPPCPAGAASEGVSGVLAGTGTLPVLSK